MADNDRKRRLLRNRGRSADPTAGAVIPHNDAPAPTSAPAPAPAPGQRRPARAQASQDVVDLVGFLRETENRRAQNQPTPTPKSMHDVLGAFRGQPAQQTTIQVLAAAATTRHLSPQAQTTHRWEHLAQENAARLEALRARQYRQEQQQYVQVQMPPDEIQRRIAKRQETDRAADTRVFDAAAALTLSYAIAKSVPSFDKLGELSEQHLSLEQAVDSPDAVAESVARDVDEQTTTADAAEMDVDTSPDGAEAFSDTDPQTEPAVETEEADVSDRLEHVPQVEQSSGTEAGKKGSVLEAAGRGIATAIGPINGDDEVAPALSPVDLNQLNQDLLKAIGAAMSSHPRSVTEMLNIERRPDHTNEAAFDLDTGVEHRQEAALGY